MFQRVRVPVLKGDKVILRSWSRKDAADLFEYARDPRVGPAAGWPPHRSQGESRFIIDEVYLSKLDWAIVDIESGKPIGNIGLDEEVVRPKIHSREVGYSIAADYWGRGIATEAVSLVVKYCFEVLNLECMTLRVEPDNEASRRVAEKCGFTFEGILRHSYKRYDNVIADMACYSLLNTEYYGTDV